MRKIALISLILSGLCLQAFAKKDALAFRAKGVASELKMPDGTMVEYTAYTDIYYVTNVKDSTLQKLNFFVPKGATQKSAILLRTYVGGYMGARASTPRADDATGRALAEGLCVCIPGSRGINSQSADGAHTGTAPNGLIDLKAAVRYLRYNDRKMPGSAERIITDGTSAGGAMSALLGATANHPDYEPYLKAAGAAKAKDDVYASVCYCPITDLDHADEAYEWLYMNQRADHDAAFAQALKFDAYINSLNLRNPKTGERLTSDNYVEYMKSYLVASASRFVAEGGEIPDSLGFQYETVYPSVPKSRPGGRRLVRARGQRSGQIVDVDLDQYLSYVVGRQALKPSPAFDNLQSPESRLFSDAQGAPVRFTGPGLSSDVQQRVRLMNPMNYITDGRARKATFWYIRHGTLDRDTSFPVPVNLATLLMNEGKKVDFALPWNRGHQGDYNLDDLFRWLKDKIKE